MVLSSQLCRLVPYPMPYADLYHQKIERSQFNFARYIKCFDLLLYLLLSMFRVASYSAKALKSLLLDDALRSQVIVAGVPGILN